MVAVMGIVAILMAIAVPSYKYVTNANRVAGEGNGLLGDLQFARSEAIKEGQSVIVCVSANGTACDNSTAWNEGWLVYSDLNGNGALDVNEPVLRIQSTFSGTDTFTANNNLATIPFNREGFAAGVATGTLITLHTSPANSASTRCLSLSVGVIAIQPYDGGACQ
jgi:type IV fimbrial biogenesis protein FimT